MSVVKSVSAVAGSDVAPQTITGGCAEIKIKGKVTSVPSAAIRGRTVIATGKWIKIAKVRDEELVEGEPISDPESFISQLNAAKLNADIFTFSQRLPDTAPRHKYYCEPDNLAVIPITTFNNWWSRLPDAVQRAVKKAQKVGVVVKQVEFDDTFVKGIQGIYDETPVRQGKAFWHYRKDFDTVKAENSTYAERSAFIGAYFKDELIGFIKMIYVGRVAEISQILSQNKHRDKRPTNALIAKAVEISAQKGIAHLVYCNYVYNDPNSSLTEFKRRNGFEQVFVPRYYIPLTFKGTLLLKMRLHHGVKGLLPAWIVGKLLKVRSWIAERKSQLPQEAAPTP